MKKKNGLTLIEVLVVMTILGILATTAIPQFSYMINSTRTDNYANDLSVDLSSARIMSLTNAKTITFKIDYSGKYYSWIVSDKNNDLVKKEIALEEISLQYSNKHFSFSPYGFLLDDNGNSLSSMFITMCHIKLDQGYRYEINSLGKITVEDTPC